MIMIHTPSPGEYALLRRPGRPDWPALICTDDMAPNDLQRPNGYLTLVLLIDRNPNFYYAASSEVQEFVPVGGHPNKELQTAHDRVLDQMESTSSSLDYWKLKTQHLRASSLSLPPRLPTPAPSPGSEYVFDQGSEFDEVEIAKSLSLREWNASKKKRTRAPPSPPQKFEKAREIQLKDLRTHFYPIESVNTAACTEVVSRRYKPTHSDYVDGELSSSHDMVKIHVGAQNEEFLIPKPEVDKLPFLSDAKIGCMATMDDGTSRLDLQCLTDFDPEHFRFVAEFLSTGQFGHSIVNEQTSEVVVQECAATWPIADRIVLEDLLDHIVKKVQQAQLQWDEAWFLALMVYETSGTPLNAYKLMKEHLVEVIADNFLYYVYEHGDKVTEPLRGLPELQRDVYRRLLESTEKEVNES